MFKDYMKLRERYVGLAFNAIVMIASVYWFLVEEDINFGDIPMK